MTIMTKYRGVCRACGQPIPRGTVVDWVRGKGIRHIECGVEGQPMGQGAYVRGENGWTEVPGSRCNCIDWPCCGH